jgi:hypothetical protein
MMESRLDTHLDKHDETDWSYCPLCRTPKPRDQMGRFNCLQCEADLEGQELEVEKIIKRCEDILDRREGDVRRKDGVHADAGSPGVTQSALFDADGI